MKDQDESDPGPNRENRDKRDESGNSGEFTQAMGRLEQAVQDLVKVTTGELGDRATSVINETSKRLEAELRLKRATGEDPDTDEEQIRRRRKHRSRHQFEDDVSGQYSTLYIDKADEKVAGVCAAFARYFGVESWVVRMGALTGLVFIPGIVFPGYWIAYFVIEKRHSKRTKSSGGVRRLKRRRRRRGRRRDSDEQNNFSATGEQGGEQPASGAQASASAEPPPRRPVKNLRHVTTDLTQAELRLRRLESFVTSDQYELHKELAKIDSATGAGS